jgi:NCS1 family nucleobase:cation symporter-1
LLRKKNLQLDEIYQVDGIYSYTAGFNPAAMIALVVGVVVAVIGYFVPALEAMYKLSWFSGFLVSFILYYLLMIKRRK